MARTTHKLCSLCKEWKTLRKFKKDIRYMAGVFCWCKKCERAYASNPEVRKRNRHRWAEVMKDPVRREAERKRGRAKYHKNPRKIKSSIYKRKYGISLKQFERRKKCSLCLQKRLLVPDHDHKTNQYRGPVCRPCNFAIALVEKYPGWIKRIKRHLRSQPWLFCT
jgi:hypothetical protein